MKWQKLDDSAIEGFDGECYARIWRDSPDLFGFDAAIHGFWTTGTVPTSELAKKLIRTFTESMREHIKWKK